MLNSQCSILTRAEEMGITRLVPCSRFRNRLQFFSISAPTRKGTGLTMKRFLGPYSGIAYSLMRIVFAFLYLSHGLKWLFGSFGGRPIPLTPLLTTAGIIETIGGSLMLVGLLTPWLALVARGELAGAHLQVN